MQNMSRYQGNLILFYILALVIAYARPETLFRLGVQVSQHNKMNMVYMRSVEELIGIHTDGANLAKYARRASNPRVGQSRLATYVL